MIMSRRMSAPNYDGDFWSDAAFLEPYPVYDELRRLEPVIGMAQHDCWAVTHYDAVRAALLAPEVFSSAKVCMMHETMN